MKLQILLYLFLFLLSNFCEMRAGIAADKPPILIGATVSLEGKYKEPSYMIMKSFQMWEREINEKGGLLGRKVKLILYDDKSNTKLVKELYQKLIEKDQVDLVFSPYGTPLTLAASEISEQHKLVMIACAASGEIIWERGFRYVYGIYALADRYFIGLLDLMAQKGYNTVSIIYDKSSPFNIDVARGVKQWSEKFKINVVHEKQFTHGEKELPAILSEMKQAGSNSIILSAYSPDCYRLLGLMQEIDYKPDVLGMTIAPIHPNFFVNAGQIADRVFGPSQWEPNERITFPGAQQFMSEFKAFTGETPSYHAGSAYAASQLYEDAIRSAQSLDNESIRNYIAALDTVTVIGRFKVSFTGKQIGHNPIIIQWQKGKKEIVWPTKMQTAPPLF